MKIAFLGRYNETEVLSGPEKVARRIFEEHCRSGEAVFYTYYFDGGKYGLREKFFGRENLAERKGCKVVRAGAKVIAAELLQMRPDVIHIINFERFATLAGTVKKQAGAKIIYTAHGIASYENENFKRAGRFYELKDKIAESRILSISDKIVFLSQKSLDTASEIYNIDSGKCVILPNGIDNAFAPPERREYFSCVLRIVFCGDTSRKEKGFDIMMNALKQLRFPYELFVLNSRSGEVSGNVHYLKAMDTDSLSAFYGDKHVFLSPSRYEPFSVAAAEAMASGLAVIASEETGMSRYIDHGRNGFVFRLSDTDSLAKLITKLNNDRKLLSEISAEASKIGEELSWSKVYGMYRELYG